MTFPIQIDHAGLIQLIYMMDEDMRDASTEQLEIWRRFYDGSFQMADEIANSFRGVAELINVYRGVCPSDVSDEEEWMLNSISENSWELLEIFLLKICQVVE